MAPLVLVLVVLVALVVLVVLLGLVELVVLLGWWVSATRCCCGLRG